jgi:hypothetical protein
MLLPGAKAAGNVIALENGKTCNSLKRNPPVVFHACETWTLTQEHENWSRDFQLE